MKKSAIVVAALLLGCNTPPPELLPPPFGPDWRWLADREDSPWYPTAKLFRQPAAGDWASVVARIAAEVARMAGGRAHD